MTPLGKSLAAGAVLAVLLAFVSIAQYGKVGGVAKLSDAGVCAGVEPAPTKLEKGPPPQEPTTYADVYDSVREALGPLWPEFSDHELYDVARGLMRLSKQVDADPRELSYELVDLAKTIVDMQPLFAQGREGGYARALAVAYDIYMGSAEVSDLTCAEVSEKDFSGVELADEAKVHRVNPFILASMAYRESRFAKRTEQGFIVRRGRKVRNCLYCVGSKGERGMFQFMPDGYIQKRFMPRNCTPFDRMCSVRGAARALAHFRCMCIDRYGARCTTDVFVAGYGLNHMPPPRSASRSRGPRMARVFLCDVREDCDYLWNGDHARDLSSSL